MTSSSTVVEGVMISDVTLILFNRRTRTAGSDPKYYVKIKCNVRPTTSIKTKKKTLDGNRATWDEIFSFPWVTADSMITFEVFKTDWLPVPEMLGTCQKQVLDLLQLQNSSGSCTLEIVGKSGNLTFNIEQPPTILPEIVSEASEGLTRISDMEHSAKAAGMTFSAHDAFADEEKNWLSFLSQFQVFMRATDKIAEIHPYVNLAWSILSVIPKTILSYHNRNDKVKQLCEKLKEIYDFVTDVDRLPKLTEIQERTLSVLIQQTIECAYFIREYSVMNIAEKVWTGTSIDDKVGAFNDKFDHIKKTMTDSITLETSIVTLRVSDSVNETKELTLLGEMPYARDAGFVSGKRCFPGTRQGLIQEITDWVNNDTSKRILVLSGAAGTGKSAVAHTIAEIFRKQNRLGSMFCFSRSYKDRRNFLFSTISRGLADGDILWRTNLIKIIKDTAIRTSIDMETQFNELIIGPAKETATIGPVVIIIDALDESGERYERRTLMDLLFDRSLMLPNNYRIIITTRPEQDIEPRYQQSTVLCKRMGNVAVNETLVDIQKYVVFRLEPIAAILDEIQKDWPEVLAKRAEGLFQWADTACRFIDPTVQYFPIVQKHWNACTSSSSTSLYQLYHAIISSQQESKYSEFLDDFKLIISAILVAREPLSINALETIFKDRIDNIKGLLKPFGSLLPGVHDPYAPLRPLHTSLFDFFNSQDQDAGKKNEYHVDTSDQSALTVGSLNLMNGMLRFNICNLETSHRRNRDLPDFDSRVQAAIPFALSYACRFWAFHLRKSKDRNGLIPEIRRLMYHNLLYLFEALSLLKEVEQGRVAMKIVQIWCQDVDNELVEHAADAWQFGYDFGDMMTEITPHLYLSALPFTPKESCISKRFLPLYPQLFSIEVGESFDPAVRSDLIRRSSTRVEKLAFSATGKYIASGFEDNVLWIWDYETGEMFYQAQVREGWWLISDIVFSSDGQLVYCCLKDWSIHIWNTKTNRISDESYENISEDRGCYASTISTDGSWIVFFGVECFVAYNRLTHQRIELMRFDTSFQPSPLLSPNSDLLAFNKEADTICLWNTRTQKLAHSWKGRQRCHALSDKSIAIGGEAGIEIWDICTLTKVDEFPTGHRFFRFSEDHFPLVSDGSFSVRNLSTGELLVGHSFDGVVSHDFKFIALGTNDSAYGTVNVCRSDMAMRFLTLSTYDSKGGVPTGTVWDNVAFRPGLGGQYLVQLWEGASEQTLRISDITSLNRILLEVEIQDDSCSFFFHGELFRAAYLTSHGLCLWNDSNEFILQKPDNHITSFAFSTSGDCLISGDEAGVIRIWNVQTRALKYGPYTVSNKVYALSLSEASDSFLIVYKTSGQTTFIEARESQSGKVLRGPFSLGSINSDKYAITLSPDERRIVCMSRSKTVILDALTGAVEHSFIPAWGQQQLSGDRKLLGWLNQIRRTTCTLGVWDITRGKEVEDPSFSQPLEQFDFSNESSQIIMTRITPTAHFQVDFWDLLTRKITTSILLSPPISRGLFVISSLPASDRINLVTVFERSVAVTINLKVADFMSSLYRQHQSRSGFGMFPLDESQRAQPPEIHDALGSGTEEILEYALTSWNKASFSVCSGTEDGWMLGPNGEVLFWIPEKRRNTFWRPCVSHIGAERYTKLRFDKFVHGSRWTECTQSP